MNKEWDTFRREEEERHQQTETRDAVEFAIDLAKKDKSVSWEVAISRSHKKVTRWEDMDSIGAPKTTR
jgi:hypothetical protein